MGMDEASDDGVDADPRPGPGTATLILLFLTLFLAGYVAIGTLLFHIEALYGGFLLVFMWTGPFEARPARFPAAVIGGLSGFTLSAAQYYLPAALGTAGVVGGLLLILLAIWLLILGKAPLFFNHAAMLFLTVGAIPMLLIPQLIVESAAALLLMAALLAPLSFILRRQQSRAP